MKKLTVTILILLTISIIAFVSCEKEEVDYRTKWAGTYMCQKESKDSIQNVLLNILMADGDSLLYVKEKKENVPFGSEHKYIDVKVKVDPYGDMWYVSGINALSYNFRGSFTGDSIYVRYNLLLGHNFNTRTIYKGQKIKDCYD